MHEKAHPIETTSGAGRMRGSAATQQAVEREPSGSASDAPQEPLLEDLLVEEVSIDGMCGVY